MTKTLREKIGMILNSVGNEQQLLNRLVDIFEFEKREFLKGCVPDRREWLTEDGKICDDMVPCNVWNDCRAETLKKAGIDK